MPVSPGADTSAPLQYLFGATLPAEDRVGPLALPPSTQVIHSQAGMAPPDGAHAPDLEAQPQASTSTPTIRADDGAPSESTPLLRPPIGASRPSYRKRAVSQSYVVQETYKTRWWTAVLAGFMALLILVAAVILLITKGAFGSGGTGKKGGSTPDFSRLPGPQPGLRNPNYVESGRKGGVASEVGICSEIGVDVLKENGTATDAAIATALCIGVTNMFSSGIGGGGFMVIKPAPTSLLSSSSAFHNPNCTQPISIDFRETAPSLSTPMMFSPNSTYAKNHPSFDAARASKIGGLSVGVPGEIRGFEKAYRMCGGGVSWERLFEPSIELARESRVGKELARRLGLELFGERMVGWMLEDGEENKVWKEIYAPEGELLKEGETLKRENYARTLEIIAREGADAFYTGPIASSLISTISSAGGILTLEDLSSYTAHVRPALTGTYLNRTYYTVHAPAAGPVIMNLLNTLESFKGYVNGGRTGLAMHRFVEALKFSFAARTEIGDPAFIDNRARLEEIMSKKYGKEVRRNITDDRTHSLTYYHPHFEVKEDHGTTHLSVIDQYGSAVALTSTVNLIFGSRVMDRETGIILNDEMDDFATPGIPDAFGLQPSPFNFPAGGKRPLSSTAPFIMDHPSGETFLTLGGSGGSRIFGAVAQVIMNLDWGMDVSNAVEQPRVHHQLSPPIVSIESGYRPDLVQALKERGHNITLFDINLGIAECQVVLRREDGLIFATSDSRKNGVPAAY